MLMKVNTSLFLILAFCCFTKALTETFKNTKEKNEGTCDSETCEIPKGKKKILFIGNPGVGKSTLLNCLMASKKPNLAEEELFPSGISVAEGLTFKFNMREVADTVFYDTPGLSDVKKRKQAAKEITKALKQNGKYQVVFVVTTESGRVRPSDLTVIKLVLESAPEIRYFGVIFNKLSNKLMDAVQKPKNQMKYLLEISESTKTSALMYPLFLERFEKLDDESNITMKIQQLDDLLEEVPKVVIQMENVADLKIDEFEKIKEELDKEISNLIKDKNLMEIKIKNMSLEFAEKIKNLEETHKKEHEASMQKVNERLEKIKREMEEKELEHKEELERLRQENKDKDEKLMTHILEEKDKQFKLMQEHYKEMQKQQENYQHLLIENNNKMWKLMKDNYNNNNMIGGILGGLMSGLGISIPSRRRVEALPSE